MKKAAVIVSTIVLAAGFFRPVLAQNDGFWGGGVYNYAFWTFPTVRLGFQEKVFIDFGLTFSTEKPNNFAIIFKGAGRFYDLNDDVFLHGGAVIGIAEIANSTAFQLGFLLGAEGMVNDTFSVTADVAPLQISANGETEAQFLRGSIGVNIYLQ